MANNILTSLESIASSLRTIENIKLSYDFYNSIYCGKYYDKYAVIRDNEEYQLYVIKSTNHQIDNFISSVKELANLSKSPFTTCAFYSQELICYNDNGDSRFYDVVLVKKALGSNIMKFFTFIPATYTSREVFDIVKRLTEVILRFLDSKIHIEGVSYKNIWIDNLNVQLTITERNTVTLGAYKTAEELNENNKKIILPLLIAWLLTLHTDIEEAYSDAFIEQLSSSDVDESHIDNYIRHAVYVEKRYNVPFTNITTHLFREESYDKCIEALKKLLCINYNDIEKLVVANHIISDDPQYDCNYPSSENRAIIQDRETKKFGFTDNFGHKITDVKYSMVTPFHEGISVVLLFDLYYAIDKYGEYVSNIGYDSLEWISEHNCFIACKGGVFTLLNRFAEVISKNKYSWIGEFSYLLSVVESLDTGKKGYMGIDGNEVTPAIYDEALSFYNAIGKVKHKEQWYNISTNGEVIDISDSDE